MAEASPIGRGKNITLETILSFLDAIPMKSMVKNDFLAFGENRMKGWRQTHSQIARQLALYYEDSDGICHPRFTSKVTLQTVAEYGSIWAKRYFVPNPFTPSLEVYKGKETNIYALIHQRVRNGEVSFTQICNDMFGIELNNLDKVRVYLSNFTDLIISDDEVSINTNVDSNNIEDVHPSVEICTIEDYFHYFDAPQEVGKENFTQNVSNQPLQQIFYGAPGTGKSFTIDDMADDDHSVRTTFHPDSDYASFVGAYKPTMEDMPLSAFVGKEVHLAQPQGGHTGTERKIVYKYVPQAFLKAYVAAWKDLDNDYYLVIEEINRGNCAQIFGDLFQLLDRNSMGCSSYAIHADDDIRQFLSTDKNGFADLTEEQAQAIREFVLEKDNGKTQAVGQDILDGNLLLLPPRLHIWATMNTSDQSLFPIDSAFKRRWDWKYMPIDYKPTDKKSGQPIDWKFRIGDNLYSWGEFLGKINPEIYTLTESSDKQMGYFFAKADRSTGIISEEVFLNKVLFYLWTDVFKDFDVSSELFKNKKANRSFRFTDFFEDPDALENFIANFNLDAEEVDAETSKDSNYSSIRVKINGKLETSMTQSVITILHDAASSHSMDDIEVAVKECVNRGETPIIKRVDNPATYTKENRWNPTIITSSDGISFVVTTMWQRQYLPMIEKLAAHFNIPFEVINE